jgi:phosphatidylglycerophosphatase C
VAHDPSEKSPAPVDRLPRRSAAQVIEQLARAREQLPAGTHPVLAFDADGTLWRGDVSNDLFDVFLAEDAIRPPAAAALEALAREVGVAQGKAPAVIARALYDSWEQRLTPSCPEDTTLKMQAWIYAGYSEEELLAYSRRVLSSARIVDRIRREVREIVGWARASGVEVVVVSASPRWPVVEAVTHLDIAPASVFALDLTSEGGVLQPELRGVFVYADGKATAVKEGRPGAAVLGAFGDSAYDTALLRLAAVPVAVNPSPGLLRAAASVPGLIELELGAT